MTKLVFSKDFIKNHKKLATSNISLKKQSRKILIYLAEGAKHQSLRLHKLSGKDIWSVSVNKSIRIIFQIEGDVIYIIDIGKHEDIY